MLLTQVALLDELLRHYAPVLGKDFDGYRNHTYRVVNFCAAFATDDPEPLRKITIAAVFHDLGIWTDKTFDYLPPSEKLAEAYLAEVGKAEWTPEIRAMIHEHHKITRYPSDPKGLVEAFRRADWVDVTRGLLTFGLPRTFLREVFSTFPDAGFHKLLVQLSARRLLSHPLSPLPMFRL